MLGEQNSENHYPHLHSGGSFIYIPSKFFLVLRKKKYEKEIVGGRKEFDKERTN